MSRKVNVLVLLSFLFILIMGAAVAYSKYKTDVSGEAKADIANWNISVNDCNIVNPDKDNETCFLEKVNDDGMVTVTRNFGIADIDYSNNNNDNVIDSKIAPGSSGTFKIAIKPNDTEVSIKYTLKASLAKENSSIKLYRSDPNGNNKVLLETDGYEGIIEYSADNASYEEVITIYVDWEKTNSPENDKIDTEIGTAGTSPILDLPVEIVFEQYRG